MKRKIMVLGINGFTGWHLQAHIQKNKLMDKYSLVGVDQAIRKLIGIKYVKTDLCQYQALAQLMTKEKPDYIINLAGVLRSEKLDDLVRVNAGISRDVLDIILKNKIKVQKVLLIGSAAEYGLPDHLPVDEKTSLNPVSYYGLSKVIQSEYAHYYSKNHGINLNIARTFNVIGKFISPALSIGSFLNQINSTKDGGSIQVGNLETKRDFIDIEDAIDGYWKLLFKGKNGEAYNLCSSESFLMKDILAYMIKKSQKKIKIVVRREYINKSDVLDIYGDYAKARQDTGWRPTTDIYRALDKLEYR